MKFIRQFSVIMTLSFLAQILEILLPLPVTASIYGLILMLVALVTKLIPLEKVEGAADFLVEILPVLFVPSTVSLIASVDALRDMLIPMLVICLVTTALIMAVTGRTAQAIIRWQERGRNGTDSTGINEMGLISAGIAGAEAGTEEKVPSCKGSTETDNCAAGMEGMRVESGKRRKER